MDLTTWRAARARPHTLPSGLEVVVKPIGLLDLAAQGGIPQPLMAMVQQLIDQSMGAGTVTIKVEEFGRYAETINMVFKACVVSPPVADEPDEEHLGINEVPLMDRIEVFNWAQGGASQLASFPDETGRDAAVGHGGAALRDQAILHPLDSRLVAGLPGGHAGAENGAGGPRPKRGRSRHQRRRDQQPA